MSYSLERAVMTVESTSMLVSTFNNIAGSCCHWLLLLAVGVRTERTDKNVTINDKAR